MVLFVVKSHTKVLGALCKNIDGKAKVLRDYDEERLKDKVEIESQLLIALKHASFSCSYGSRFH